MRAAELVCCIGSLLIACASSPERTAHLQSPTIEIDYPAVAMPTLDFEPQVIPSPEVPIRVPDAPASAELFQCHITFVDAPEAVGTAWRIHSISSTRPSVRTALTEQERFFANWYPDLRQPTVFFHVETDRP
jgi:hypothetical protein